MDESPIAGSLRGIRRSVSSNVFTGRAVPPPVAQPDPQTTSLISQNTLALNTISGQLTNISDSVRNLNGSLGALRNNLEVSGSLDRQREAAKQNRERQLAEQGLREGKESELENKIQNALLSPVRKIAEKAQGFLGRLANFFFILLGGWLANTTVEFLKILSGKNIDKFNEFKRKLGKDLLAVGAILVIASVGIKGLVRLSASLAANAFRITVNALLVSPFKLLLKFFQNIVLRGRNALLKSMGLLGNKPGLLPKVGKSILTALPGAGLIASIFGGGKGKVTGDITNAGAKTGNRFTRFLGNLNPFKSSKVTGEVIEQGGKKIAKTATRGIFGKLFGPVVNFLLDISMGEKIEKALAGAAGFAAGAKVAATLGSGLLLSPDPWTKIAYGALVLGGGLMGEQAAKSMMTGIMNMFGMGGDKKGEVNGDTNQSDTGDITTDNKSDSENNLNVTGMQFGGSELIKAVDNNKSEIGDKISSLEEAPPNILTVPMGGTNVPSGSGASGSSSSNTPTSNIPNIASSDATNPYLPYSESVYGVLD